MSTVHVPTLPPEELAKWQKRADRLSDDNPFRESMAERLAQHGGLHRTPPTDQGTAREEQRIRHLRETAEALAAGGNPF